MSCMQEQIKQQPAHSYAGIDVGKSQLDIFILPDGMRFQLNHYRLAPVGSSFGWKPLALF